MSPDNLDRILSTDEDIVPASQFVASVMDLVRQEASAPPPIPFPWLRLVSGMALTTGVVALLAWTGVAEPLWAQLVATSQAFGPATLERAADAAVRTGAAWTVGALLLSLATSAISMRLAWPRR
jgi:hypothetical protein